MLGNSAGVIDQDFESNEIKVMLYNANEYKQVITKGEKIAQMLILPHLQHLAKGVILKYDERTGGFGSTDS
jgi:dUTPase